MRRKAASRLARFSRRATRERSMSTSLSAVGPVTGRGVCLSQPAAVDRGTPARVAIVGSRVSRTSRTRRWS